MSGQLCIEPISMCVDILKSMLYMIEGKGSNWKIKLFQFMHRTFGLHQFASLYSQSKLTKSIGCFSTSNLNLWDRRAQVPFNIFSDIQMGIIYLIISLWSSDVRQLVCGSYSSVPTICWTRNMPCCDWSHYTVSGNFSPGVRVECIHPFRLQINFYSVPYFHTLLCPFLVLHLSGKIVQTKSTLAFTHSCLAESNKSCISLSDDRSIIDDIVKWFELHRYFSSVLFDSISIF